MTTSHTKLLQQVCGAFLYYARAVDCTMIHALNNLGTRVKDGTQKTAKALNHFLDYCATHIEATVLYQASNMILHNHSDIAYLVAIRSRSRVDGYTYLGNDTDNKQIINDQISILFSSRCRNRSILYECKTITTTASNM